MPKKPEWKIRRPDRDGMKWIIMDSKDCYDLVDGRCVYYDSHNTNLPCLMDNCDYILTELEEGNYLATNKDIVTI